MPKLLNAKRKKINFMISEETFENLEKLIPGGQRSDFINAAIEEMLIKQGREKAIDFFEEFKKKQKKSMDTRDIVKFIRHERRKNLL